MRKVCRLVIGFFLISFVIPFFASNVAFADEFGYKITDGSNSQVEQLTFNRNEIPWLWVDLKKNESDFSGWWKYFSGAENPILYDGSTNGGIVWQPLTSWGWSLSSVEGDYEVRVQGYGANSILHVTPEPISSALFLLGGATLALGAYRKKKQKL